MRADATATEQKSPCTPPARRRQSALSLRPIAAVVVIMAHVTLLMLLPKLRDRALSRAYDETPSVLFFLPSIGSKEATAPEQSPARPPAARARQDHSRSRRAPEPPAKQAESSSAPVAIDWSQEAEAAAGRQVDADEEAARNARAFSAPKAPANLAAAPPAGPRFKWYHARVQRIESIPGGGFLINLNDQCAVVVMIMIVPVCQIGKIEARGDLFQHMDDPSPLGGWDAKLP